MFEGKVAIVTGGGTGIGAACVKASATGGPKRRIVAISPLFKCAARSGEVDHDAAEKGLSQRTVTLAPELAPTGIAVEGDAPGMIPTPTDGKAIEDAAYCRTLQAGIPSGRAGEPGEEATLAYFLRSPAADCVTGTTVAIGGALSLAVARGA